MFFIMNPTSLFYKITKTISDFLIPFPNPHYDSMKTKKKKKTKNKIDKQKHLICPSHLQKCRDIQGIIGNQDSKGIPFSFLQRGPSRVETEAIHSFNADWRPET